MASFLAMLLVERSKFGLNELLGLIPVRVTCPVGDDLWPRVMVLDVPHKLQPSGFQVQPLAESRLAKCAVEAGANFDRAIQLLGFSQLYQICDAATDHATGILVASRERFVCEAIQLFCRRFQANFVHEA